MKNLEIIPVVYSCDDNYAAYLGVSIKSLIENSTFSHQYKIYILDGGISEVNKKRIKSLEKSNITIEFVDVSQIMDKFDLSLFKLSLHFTIATYYRFFLPHLFPNFSKLCYIDCDTVVLKDIALLYETDIKGYYLGVTRDIENIKSCNQDKDYKKYFYHTLEMKNHLDYFNAGVLVCNIEKMKSDNLTEQLIKTLEKIGNPRYVDQCILNSVCEGKVKFISQNWNFTWHTIFDKNYQQYVQSPFLEAYEKAAQDPYILHFTGCGLKPWLNPSLENSEYFWTYARLTPFYEEILQKLIGVNLPVNSTERVHKVKYKLFNFIPLWSYKISSTVCKYKLFGLPLFSVKTKGYKTTYKFCGLPLWKIRRKTNKTTKYYFCGLPIIKLNKK